MLLHYWTFFFFSFVFPFWIFCQSLLKSFVIKISSPLSLFPNLVPVYLFLQIVCWKMPSDSFFSFQFSFTLLQFLIYVMLHFFRQQFPSFLDSFILFALISPSSYFLVTPLLLPSTHFWFDPWSWRMSNKFQFSFSHFSLCFCLHFLLLLAE